MSHAPSIAGLALSLYYLYESAVSTTVGVETIGMRKYQLISSNNTSSGEMSCPSSARCLFHKCNFTSGAIATFKQLHGFFEASQDAYAAVIYLHTTCASSSPTVTLITVKTKVAPKTTVYHQARTLQCTAAGKTSGDKVRSASALISSIVR